MNQFKCENGILVPRLDLCEWCPKFSECVDLYHIRERM
jgi:hypothetical protein